MTRVAGAAALALRPGRDEDGPGVIALIGAVFAEYPGCVLDVEAEAPDLKVPASSLAAVGGRFWVAELDGAVVGCIGFRPSAAGEGVELVRLYVRRTVRRQGLARRLVALAEAAAAERGAAFVELWTDRRFEVAHRLYAALGYRRGPQVRHLDDLSRSVEFHYSKVLSPRRG